MQYLLFSCFDETLTEQEIHDFLLRVYFVFQDYAAAHWIDHLEHCARNLLPEKDLQRLGSTVKSFLQQHWLASSMDHPRQGSPIRSFEVFKSWDVSEKLEVLTDLATSRKSHSDHLAISDRIQRVRRIFEQLVVSLSLDSNEKNVLSSYYGSGWFKCSKLWCDWFHDGFPDQRARDKHVSKHEKPFCCTIKGCPAMELGCETENDLKKYISKYHPALQDQDWKFPKPRVIKNADIFKAAASGDLRLVESFLDQGVSVNGTTGKRDKKTALYFAVFNQHAEVVKVLLKQGAQICLKQPGIVNVFETAVKLGNCEIARVLMNSELNTNWAGYKTETILSTAAHHENGEMVQLLLETVNNFNDEQFLSALEIAISKGHEKIVQLITQAIASSTSKISGSGNLLDTIQCFGNVSILRLVLTSGIAFTEQNYSEALVAAAEKGHEEFLRGLLRWIPDISGLRGNCSALEEAISYGHDSVAQLLIDAKFNVNAQTSSGETFLSCAIKSKSETMMRYLLDREADPNKKNSCQEESVLCYAVRDNNVALICLLLHYGIKINEKYDQYQETVLHRAAKEGTKAVVDLLLREGADPLLVDADGYTALHMSSQYGNLAAVQVLSNHGIDFVNARRAGGITALHDAATWGHEAVVELLIDQGVDVDICDNNGRTALNVAKNLTIADLILVSAKKSTLAIPNLLSGFGLDRNANALEIGVSRRLHRAICAGNIELAEELLRNGTNIFATTPLGKTALDLAAESGSVQMTKLLLKYGTMEPKNTMMGEDEETLLHRVAARGHVQIMEL